VSEEIQLIVGLVAFVMLAGVFTVAYLMGDAQKAKRALRGPSVPIAGLVPGKVGKVTGAAHSRGAPARTFRGEPCVFVRIEVLHFFRRTGTDGAVSEEWRPVAAEEQGGAFELEDESGTATIDPAGAVWVLEPSWYDVDWDDLSSFEEELVARHAGKVERGFPAKLRQTVVQDGQRLSACGIVAPAADGGGPTLASSRKVPLAIGPG